ncbi:MAG: FHA domain-containing protein, partial [Solimonas sp.]
VELRVEYTFVDGGEHQLKNVSRAVQVFHVRQARAAASADTTTRILPQILLRFEGTDSMNQKHGFDVALDKLMARSQGMVIGRSADQCDLVVAHATVSRRHARLSLTGNALQVEDLGSTNGTAVGGTKLGPGGPAALQTGSKLRLGDVELLVRQL